MAGGDSKKKKQVPSLGKSLIRSRFSGKRNAGSDSFLRDQFSQPKTNNVTLNSITEETSINSYINEVQLAGARFEAEREENFKLVDEINRLDLLTPEKELESRKRNEDLRKLLNIPRRPQWNKSITCEEQIFSENIAFLSWRRKMAELEDKNGFIMTPFERNLEVWRQLWRVLEKSDLVLQIIDCRNPFLFVCSDLIEYALELDKNKICITIINKSDLLSQKQRLAWAQYFKKNNLQYVFYSALAALGNLNEEFPENEDLDSSHPNPEECQNPHDKLTSILSSSQLLNLIKEKISELKITDRKSVAGFVGYPNVGKSSTINSLIGKKLQQVSSTPGKTKHFQTIHLSESLIICDCPGLVFPSFVTTKAELVCNGILPIDQMRDYMSPCAFVVQRVPLEVFEKLYNIKLTPLEDIPSNENLLEIKTRDLLKSFALSRGYSRGAQGNPDEFKAARYILKDFTNAKIIWCQPPPQYDEAEFNKENFDKIMNVVPGNMQKQKPENKNLQQPKQNNMHSSFDTFLNAYQDTGNLKFQAHIMPPGGNPSSTSFEFRKKMHKGLKRHHPKKKIDL